MIAFARCDPQPEAEKAEGATITPRLRKFALTAHITSSVGWLGAVAGFLALAIASPTSQDAQLVRGIYLAMALTGWYVIVPLCLASLVTGLIQSQDTQWGLFRHYWVLAKFLITSVSALILFGFTKTLNHLGKLAADTTLSIDNRPNQSPILHAGLALLALLVTTTLSVYKPWGKTRYGRPYPDSNSNIGEETGVGPSRGSTISTPRWVYVFGIIVIVLALLFVIQHLTNGGLGGHTL